ncbi:MAG TPA: hypothetical protein VJ183_08400 [Chloroflexia bacterium]|nr:hypothetical protein [Chloroflexia bacterium]
MHPMYPRLGSLPRALIFLLSKAHNGDACGSTQEPSDDPDHAAGDVLLWPLLAQYSAPRWALISPMQLLLSLAPMASAGQRGFDSKAKEFITAGQELIEDGNLTYDVADYVSATEAPDVNKVAYILNSMLRFMPKRDILRSISRLNIATQSYISGTRAGPPLTTVLRSNIRRIPQYHCRGSV